MDIAVNLSDHCPVSIDIICSLSRVSDIDNNSSACNNEPGCTKLRWDKACPDLYYDYTRIAFQSLFDQVSSHYYTFCMALPNDRVSDSVGVSYHDNSYNLCSSCYLVIFPSSINSLMCTEMYNCVRCKAIAYIEDKYNCLVSLLNCAARATIPIESHDFRKFW